MAKRFTYIPNRVIDTDGISDGASIFIYDTGTTTPVTIYSDEALTTPISNPYVVAAGAAVPAIYHNASGNVRVRIVESDGTVVSDDDPFERPVTDVELASSNSAKGAALVGYQSGRTSAVAETLKGRADKQPLYVDQFGTLGTADDSSVFQAAIDAALETGERKLKLNPGTYIIDTVALPSWFRFECDVPHRTVLQHKAASTNPMFTVDAGPVIVLEMGGVNIEGNGTAGEDCFRITSTPTGGVNSGNDGGLWYSWLHDMEIDGFGGKGIWLRGGNARNTTGAYDFLTPNQFIQLSRVRVFRPATATSRCLSITGQVGQVSMDGECMFDSSYVSASGRAGANVVISREFVNGSDYGDLWDARDENGSTYPADYSTDTFSVKSGWTAVDGTAPSRIQVRGTIQNSRYGVVTDSAVNITLDECWFENIDRAVTATTQSHVGIHSCRFANAGGSSADGYVIKSDNSRVHYANNYFAGTFDKLTVQYVGSLSDGGGNYSSSATEGDSIGSFRGIAISANTLSVGGYNRVNATGSGTFDSPESLTTIASNLPAGARLTVRCATYVEINSGGNITFNGNPFYGPADVFELVHGDSPGEWVLVADAREHIPGVMGVTTRGDTAATLQPFVSDMTQIWNTPLTANRAITFNGGEQGNQFRIVRKAAATGAFNLSVPASPSTVNLAAGEWCDVEHDGTNWIVTAGTGV